jgi:hypothetical protein
MGGKREWINGRRVVILAIKKLLKQLIYSILKLKEVRFILIFLDD